MNTCSRCGSALFPGSRARYCSSACRVAAFRLRRQRAVSVILGKLLADLSGVTPVTLRSMLIAHVSRLKDVL